VAISISVTDIFKMLLQRNDNDRDKAIRYMERVLDSAKRLSEIWFETFKRLASEPDIKVIPDGVVGWNYPPYYELQEFYRTTSSVIGKHHVLRDSFVDGIANLLSQREFTREAYQNVITASRTGVFLDADNSSMPLNDLRASVEVLQREVAALEVLLERFRAIGK
jgi:hypothetical protein